MKKECIFCKIIKGEIKGDVVRVSNSFIALKDRSPVAPGHLLVIPKKHMGNLLDMPNSLGEELIKFTKELAGEIIDNRQGDGFNLISNNLPAAGQVVEHLHFHLIPRKENDGIRFFIKT